MKKLGFGLMRMPILDKTNPADVDIEQVKKMVEYLLRKGLLILILRGCTMDLPAKA